MQNKPLKFLIIILAVAVIVPQIALAAWWNPFSWGIWNRIFHFQQTQQQQQKQTQTQKNPPVVGGDKDAHGCIGSAGYTWCEAKQKCLRTWEEKCDNSVDSTAGWKIFINTKYGIEVKYPSGWTAKNAVVACTRDNGYTPPECADGIGEGVTLTSTAPYNPLTNPEGILIMYRENLHTANPPEAGCTGAGNFNIGDKTFSRFICGGVSDIISYINKIKNSQGDILTQKYTAGPYFNDAFFVEYWQTGSDNKLVTYVTDYNLGFDILADLKSYYAKNNTLPPDISALTPDIWCYNTIIKDQPIINNEEQVAQRILSTFKFINSPPVVGADKDAHGCIGSAGYTWCEPKQKCLRPWEEKCQ